MAFRYEKFVNGYGRALRGIWTPAMPSEICLEAGAVLLTHPAWQDLWMWDILCWLAGGQVSVREAKLSPNISFERY